MITKNIFNDFFNIYKPTKFRSNDCYRKINKLNQESYERKKGSCNVKNEV